MKIELTIKKKSRTRIVIGLLFLIVAAVYLLKGETFSGILNYEKLYAGLLIIAGIINIWIGTGNSIEDLFGGRFVELNEKDITLKTKTFGTTTVIKITELKSAEIGINTIKLNLKDNEVFEIYMGHLSFNELKEIKNELLNYFKENKIEVDK